jgi:hypothetical protein
MNDARRNHSTALVLHVCGPKTTRNRFHIEQRRICFSDDTQWPQIARRSPRAREHPFILAASPQCDDIGLLAAAERSFSSLGTSTKLRRDNVKGNFQP